MSRCLKLYKVMLRRLCDQLAKFGETLLKTIPSEPFGGRVETMNLNRNKLGSNANLSNIDSDIVRSVQRYTELYRNV